MTLVASALAGGDCIDDADALRAGRTAARGGAGSGLCGQGAIHPGDVPCILEEPGRGRPYLPEA